MTTQAEAGSAVAADGLLGERTRLEYNQEERRFSVLIRRRLDELLEGQRNDLFVLRVHPDDPTRLGVMGTPLGIDRGALRFGVVRRLLEDALRFLAAGSAGGPTSQEIAPDGRLVERRDFPTRYPHIVIEREDVFAPDGACAQTSWCARRVQNQRAQTQINRLLDVANLGLEVAGTLLR